MSLCLRLVFNLAEIEAMRDDRGTQRGLRAQQKNSCEASGTTSNPPRQTQPTNAQSKKTKKSTPMPLRPADQYKTIRCAKTKPARNQTDGRRAKQIRRAIKNTGKIPTEGHQIQSKSVAPPNPRNSVLPFRNRVQYSNDLINSKTGKTLAGAKHGYPYHRPTVQRVAEDPLH